MPKDERRPDRPMGVKLLIFLLLASVADGETNCKSECDGALGMEDLRIKDSQIFGGSVYSEDYESFGPQNARLHNRLGYRADPSTPASSNIIGIDLGGDVVVTGIASQGYGNISAAEWVTSFSLMYQDPSGNRVMVQGPDGNLKIFQANTDSNSVKRNNLPIPIFTSSVFLMPLASHNNVGLRLELYGCKGGHYFVAWLMSKETYFTVAYADPSTYEYQEAVQTFMDEVDDALSTTWGFLFARVRELSPQSHTLPTMVTAIVEIHCLRSSEQVILAKLKSVLEKGETSLEPNYFEYQYPNRCGCPPLRAHLKLNKTLKYAVEVWKSKRFVRYPISLELGCSREELQIFYTWQMSIIDKSTGFYGPLRSFGKKSTFMMSTAVMGLNQVYIQCMIEVRGASHSVAYDYGYINVVRAPLEAAITDIGLDDRSRIRLSAHGSFDAGRKRFGTRGLGFSWFCRLESETFPSDASQVVDVALGRTKGDGGCFGFGPGELSSVDEVLELNIAEMEKSKKFIFKLIVIKDARNASAVYEYTVKPQFSISISCLSNCGAKVISQEGLLLEALCTGNPCQNVSKYNWTLHLIKNVGENVFSSAVHDVTFELKLDSKRFWIEGISRMQRDTENVRYVVTAAASIDGGTSAASAHGNFTFVVNSPPKKLASNSNASCHMTPEQGDAYTTDFFITCWGWHDEDEPLTYQFAYYKGYGMVVIQTGSLHSVTTKLPAGDAAVDHFLTLEVLVGDSFNDFVAIPLSVKVQPMKAHAVNQKFVDEKLDFIRDLVSEGDADRATELAFTLMSTVKDFNNGDSENNVNSILRDMRGLEVKSVAHVTKVAAVVVMATEMTGATSLSSQESAVALLSEATNFMSSFTSNSTHDASMARNVSSVLLNGIGNVLRVSSKDANVQTEAGDRQESAKEITKKTLELAMMVGESLAKTAHSSEERTAVTSNFVDIVIYKKKPEDLSGKVIKEGNAGILLPDSKELFPGRNDSVTLQLMSFKENPFTWDNTSTGVRSAVIDVTLRTSDGDALKVANLSQALELHIPGKKEDPATKKQPEHLFVKPDMVRYHSLFIPSKEHVVTVKIAAAAAQRLAVYTGHGFRPSPENFTSAVTLPDFTSCQKSNQSEEYVNCTADPHEIKMIGYESGDYSIAISLVKPPNGTRELPGKPVRSRRSCRSSGGRHKRSCVEVKDPPTTPPPTPMIVAPNYNAVTDVNYTLSVTIGTCLYWSEEEEKWTSEGCKVGPGSHADTVHCLCTHLSSFGGDFFVAPNPIDFDKVWAEFGRLGETGNFVVLATVCTMLGSYLLGLFFARRSDKKDELKVIADFHLSDQSRGEYTYAISVQTGAWRKSGTSANVGLILYGDEGVTEPIILAHQHLHRRFFARGSVNIFTLSVAKPLGSLFKVKVWHDNSGKSPSWFLLGIAVEDTQTHEKWHFIAHQWLAVEKDDGEIEIEITAAGEKDRSEFKNVFHSRTQRAVGDSHLWVSLFTKAPHSHFTRCQRLSCCLSIIFCAMVTGAMFYRFGAEAKDTFHLGPLKMSWTEIKIGIQSGLVAIPVNLMVVTIFKNIKPSGDHEGSPGCLPHFCVYIAWFLCVSAILASAAFTVFYSLTWGAEISNQWLISMTISFLEDVFLIQPIKVVVIVCLLSVIIRKPLDHEDVRDAPFVPEPVAAHALDEEKYARIVEMEELENSRRQRRKEIKAFRTIVEIVFFLLYVLLLLVVCYGNRGSVRYSLTRSLKDVFNNFDKVDCTTKFWNWTRDTFVPGLYNVRWYNGQPFNYDEGFISNRETFLVGMPRLKQVRVRPEPHCATQKVAPQLVTPRCLPHFTESKEDTTPYSKPGWIPVSNDSIFSNAVDLDFLCPKPWQYKTAHALNAEPTQGQLATYDGSGFVANLGYNADSALAVIESLENNQWIDDKTAAVLVECTVFEPSSSLFSVVKYLYERYPTGGVVTSSTVKTLTVYLPQGSKAFRTFYQICQVGLMLVLVGLTFAEVARASRGMRAYCTRFWRWMEMLLISFTASGLAIMFLKEKYARKYVEMVRANPFDNWSTDQLVRWSELEDYLLSFVTFLITIKFLRLFQCNRHISQMWMTLKAASAPVFSFGLVFALLLLAFTSFGVLAFGSTVKSYSTVLQTVRSLLQMVIGGKTSFYQLKWAGVGVLGPIYLFAYLLTSLAVMVNTFVAILNESYMESREEEARVLDEMDDVELAAFLWSRAKTSISSLQTFLRSSFYRKNKCKYEVNGDGPTKYESERYLPKLASMDSLNEIDDETQSLKEADDLMSEVQTHLSKMFPGEELFKVAFLTEHELERSLSDLSLNSRAEEDLDSDQSSLMEDDICNSPKCPLIGSNFDSVSQDSDVRETHL